MQCKNLTGLILAAALLPCSAKSWAADAAPSATSNPMDWFFNEYVYGTALPSYTMTSTVSQDTDASALVSFKIRQSDGDKDLRMPGSDLP
jgi:hypothetical protein